MNKAGYPKLPNRLLSGLLLRSVVLGDISAALAADVLLQNSQQIESLPHRAETLSFGGLGPNNYYLAKARTWLALATDEYYDKDDNGSDKVRPGLWHKVAALKKQGKLSCGKRPAAEAEAELT